MNEVLSSEDVSDRLKRWVVFVGELVLLNPLQVSPTPREILFIPAMGIRGR